MYGGKGNFGGGNSGGGFGERKMFKATCADCGSETQVPFEPKSGRPVYCRNCYQNHKK